MASFSPHAQVRRRPHGVGVHKWRTWFGLPLTAAESKVNACRQLPQNNKYKYGQFGASQALCALGKVAKSDKKPTSLTSPGLRLIFNNKAADGYWNSAHMMVQAEAVDDVS